MRTRSEARKFLAEWQKHLDLLDFVIRARLRKNLPLYDQSQEWVNGSDGSAKTAIIELSTDQTIPELEWSIAHEASHVVTDPTCNKYHMLVDRFVEDEEMRNQLKMEYNEAENRVIEHYLRIIYRLIDKQYPAHRVMANEVAVGLPKGE